MDELISRHAELGLVGTWSILASRCGVIEFWIFTAVVLLLLGFMEYARWKKLRNDFKRQCRRIDAASLLKLDLLGL